MFCRVWEVMSFARIRTPSSKISSGMKAWLTYALWFAFFLLCHARNCPLVSLCLRRSVGECGYPAVQKRCRCLLLWNSKQKGHRRQIFQKKITYRRGKMTVQIGNMLEFRARTVKGNSLWYKDATLHDWAFFPNVSLAGTLPKAPNSSVSSWIAVLAWFTTLNLRYHVEP